MHQLRDDAVWTHFIGVLLITNASSVRNQAWGCINADIKESLTVTFHGGTETGTDLSLCHLLRIFHLCSIAQYSPWVGYVGRARQDAVRTARDIGTACGRQVGPSQPALAQELAQPAQSGQRPLLQRTLHHTMRRICRAHVGLHICRRSRLQVGSARLDCMLEARRPFLLSDPNFFLNLTVTAPVTALRLTAPLDGSRPHGSVQKDHTFVSLVAAANVAPCDG